MPEKKKEPAKKAAPKKKPAKSESQLALEKKREAEKKKKLEEAKKEAQRVLLTMGREDEVEENDDISLESLKTMDTKTKGHIASNILFVILAIAYSVAYGLALYYMPWIQANWPWLYDLLEGNEWVNRIAKSLFAFFVTIGASAIVRVIVSLLAIGKSYKTITLAKLGGSAIKYACWLIAIFAILAVWGVDTATILASAGILALVIGLGAQTLIADIIGGIEIVFEDQFQIGDVIVVDDFRGTVKEIGLSCVKIEDAARNIKVIRNHQISTVINLSRKRSVAVCDCDVDYDTNLDYVREVIEAHLDEMRVKIPAIKKRPTYLGVQALGASGITIRIVATVDEADKFGATRAMNEYILNLFNEFEIAIPFNQIVVSKREEAAPSNVSKKKRSK